MSEIPALELVSGTAHHLRPLWPPGGVVQPGVGAALQLVRPVAAVPHTVTLPPEGDALLVTAFEHPLVTLAPREVGLRQRVCAVLGDHVTILLVAGVGTVRVAVTPPRLEDAVAVVTGELPVLTVPHLQ